MSNVSVISVPLLGGHVSANVQTKFLRLQDLFALGNQIRAEEGLPQRDVADYLTLNTTQEYLREVEAEIGYSPIKRIRGRNGGTWAHLYVAIDAAMYLHPKAKLAVIREFVDRRILYWRDASADDFKLLNKAIDETAPALFGKPAHKGHYINLAKIIRKRILGDTPSWDVATAAQLRERDRIETALVTMLKAGVVRDWDHLKELAEKV